jgi:RHS repeat-associated protein
VQVGWSRDKTTNGFTQQEAYVLDLGGEQVTETGGDGQWLHTNVFVEGQLLATYDDAGVHSHITDWLGNRRVQANYLGQVEATYQNLPFGEMLPQNNSVFLGATEHHFTGKERDTESGNDDFGARYYNSSTGRWLSPDWSVSVEPVPYAKLDDPQSLNLYSYTLNDPLGKVDPDGHCALEGIEIGSGCNALIADAIDTSQSKNQQRRKSIAANAQAARGSTAWAYDAKPCGNKCSKFVGDILGIVGIGIHQGYKSDPDGPPVAGDWLNPKAKIENWTPLQKGEKPMPGDVAAEEIEDPHVGATAHLGIVIDDGHGGVTAVAAGHDSVYRTNEFFDPNHHVTFRRYRGE